MTLKSRIVASHVSLVGLFVLLSFFTVAEINSLRRLLSLEDHVQDLSLAWYEFKSDSSAVLVRNGYPSALFSEAETSYVRLTALMNDLREEKLDRLGAGEQDLQIDDLKQLWAHAQVELSTAIERFTDYLDTPSGRYMLSSWTDTFSVMRRFAYMNRTGVLSDRDFMQFTDFLDQHLVFLFIGDSFEAHLDRIARTIEAQTQVRIRQTTAATVVGTLSSLAVAALFVVATLRSTVRRLASVRDIVDRVAERNRAIHESLKGNNHSLRSDLAATPLLPKDDYRDEISDLLRCASDLLLSERTLVTDVATVQIQKRNAELRALQSQINPHFLYNTLDVVYWEARIAGAPEVENLVRRLSDFFRLSLARGPAIIPLERELRQVRSYVELEQLRSDLRFRYIEEVDPDVLDLRVLRLLLQPIVENAIRHGIQETAEANGRIVIRARRRDDALVVEVENDGPPPREDKNGYGLRNVRDRINLVCGSAYGVVLLPRPDGGTLARLVLPADLELDAGEPITT